MIPGPIGIVECPDCKTKTYRLLLGGREGVCINRKCKTEIFKVVNFTGGSGAEGNKSKSYNNSYKDKK